MVLLIAVVLVIAGCTSAPPPSHRARPSGGSPSTSPTTLKPSTAQAAAGLPPIRHVFVIMLENEGYGATFGDPAADPYLASTLPRQGALLQQYDAIGHFSNDNYVAFVSGQAPNPDNQADCQRYVNFPPSATLNPAGQMTGDGCVYPASVPTVVNQLEAKGLTWKGYMQDMGNDPSRESPVCGHPALGAPDNTQKAVPGDGYVSRHDPFVYFHSIIDHPGLCDSHVVPLGSTNGAMPAGTPRAVTGLAVDLRSVSTTPNFSFITPNVCFDGHDFPCANQKSGASPLADIDTFLSTWVPRITGSPAFKKDGLLEVTFDEASPTDTSSCCGETPGPAAAHPGISGPGGGRIGTVLLSPFIAPGTVSTVPYNHFSSLATIEDLFGLPRLGEARTVTSTFGRDVFTAFHGR